jgi:hypothetical protein
MCQYAYQQSDDPHSTIILLRRVNNKTKTPCSFSSSSSVVSPATADRPREKSITSSISNIQNQQQEQHDSSDNQLLRPSSEHNMKNCPSSNISTGEGERKGERERWHVLPSVQERIESLYRAFPSPHPLEEDLRELVLDLRKDNAAATATTTKSPPLSHDHQEARPPSSSQNGIHIDIHSKFNFTQSLLDWKQATKAHRLHASLWRRCTTQCHPKPYYDNVMSMSGGMSTRGGRPGTGMADAASASASLHVSLSQYMGDVLCASYLMAHSNANANGNGNANSNSMCVEGGDDCTFQQWVRYLLAEQQQKDSLDMNSNTVGANVDVDAITMYRSWVFVHSFALQNWAFTMSQRKRLGLMPMMHSGGDDDDSIGGDQHNNDNDNALIAPHEALTSIVDTLYPMEEGMLTQLLHLLQRQTTPLCTHRMTFSHFGPLGGGASFRGRDLVQSSQMCLVRMAQAVQRSTTTGTGSSTPSLLHRPQFVLDITTRQQPIIDDDEQTEMVTWMLVLMQQCKNTRPMTVMPPLVEIMAAHISTQQPTW